MKPGWVAFIRVSIDVVVHDISSSKIYVSSKDQTRNISWTMYRPPLDRRYCLQLRENAGQDVVPIVTGHKTP